MGKSCFQKKERYDMIILNVNKVAKDYGFGDVLKDISFTLNEGEKVAIVGDNGTGKSTLLKIIAGIENYKNGSITLKKDAVVEYLEQGDKSDNQKGMCIEILNSAFENLFKIEQELLNYEQQMANETNVENLNILIKRYSYLQEQFLNMGGYEIENQINYVVNGLKINKSLLNRDFQTLSGGERTLINFAKILLSKPDLLLLDEPTNHLDIERIEWLEQYIKDYKGTIIIVSHDRYFLDKVINKIIQIDEGKAKIYFGNYTKYLEEKEREETKEFEIYKVQQRKIEEMEKAIKRLKEWGKLSDNPMFFRRAKAIQSNLDRFKENAIEKPKEIKNLNIQFSNSGRASQDVLTIKDFTLKIGDNCLLNNANCLIQNGEKVALLGANGTGKTSLLKHVLFSQFEGLGICKIANNQHVGYLSQIINFYDENQTVLWTFMNELGMDEQAARSPLYNFQFYKSDWIKKVSSLSGGEKLRLKLAIILQTKVNLLIFDEPTNHIDIITREVLEESLKNFKGTIIFISHDRYFINKIANKIIAFENKQLKTYNGDYDYYLEQKKKGV